MQRMNRIPMPSDRRAREAFFALGDALAKLGREVAEMETYLTTQRPKQQPAEPTWTSGDGTTRRLSEMPTPHLENIASGLRRRGMSGDEHFGGVFRAIQDELQKRVLLSELRQLVAGE